MKLTNISAALLLLTGLTAIATPARAELKVCNEDSEKRSVAIALKKDGKWTSEGWWTVDPGKCQRVISGALKQRYYYYRATSGGEAVHEGKYKFCTSKKAFTIEGEADCESRGHKGELFASIDTGKNAKSYTFALKTNQKSEDQAPLASAEIKEEKLPFERGSLGELYTVTGVWNGCFDGEDGGRNYCSYHADGWKHFAYEGGGTPASLLKELQFIGPGTALQFVGDMISFGDITAEVAIAKYERVKDDKYADVREKMQGYWYSKDDDSGYIIIEGAEQKDIYDANLAGQYYLQWLDECEGSRGIGPVLLGVDPENRDQPVCHFIVSVDSKKLVLSYVGGNGQDKTYTRDN